MQKIRNKQIDVMRGIAILLVILGHSIGYVDNNLNKCILAFHMPLFFILSGLLAKDFYNLDQNMFKYLFYKIKKMLKYIIIYGIIYTLYDIVINFFKSNSITNISLGNFFVWFFWVLLITEILFMTISKLINLKNIKNYIIIIILSFLSALFSSIIFKNSTNFIVIIPTSFLFYVIGFVYKDKILSSKLFLFIKENLIYIITIFIILALLNAPVLMYINNYGYFLIFILTSILGLFIITFFGKVSEENKMLNFCGQNSVIFYIMHFLIYRIIQKLLILTNMIKIETLIAFITFFLSTIFLIFICKIWLYLKNKITKLI